jgi:hypothetical protein
VNIMRLKHSLLLLLAAMPWPVAAQTVSECDWRTSAQAIAEPWEEMTARFANGAIRLAVLDVLEPAAGAFHLLVLSPPFDELGSRQCRVVSLDNALGFAALSLRGAKASYDPVKGLSVRMNAIRWSGNDQFFDAPLTVTINQATGAISAVLD